MNHSNLVNKFISIQKAMKIPDATLIKGSFTRDERNHLLHLLMGCERGGGTETSARFSCAECSQLFLL